MAPSPHPARHALVPGDSVYLERADGGAVIVTVRPAGPGAPPLFELVLTRTQWAAAVAAVAAHPYPDAARDLQAFALQLHEGLIPRTVEIP